MVDNTRGGTTFTSAGGAGSISCTVAEISEAAVALHRIAQLMDPLTDRLRSEWVWLGEASTAAAVYPIASLEAMRAALWQCMGLQGGVARLANKAAQAGSNYAQTESRNANALANAEKAAMLRDGLGTWAWGPLAPAKFGADILKVLETAKHDGLRDAVEQVLRHGGAYAAGVLGPGTAMMYLLSGVAGKDASTTGARPAFIMRKLFDATDLSRPGHLTVRQVPAQEWDPANAKYYPPGHATPAGGEPCRVEASIRGMLDGSNDAYKYPPGSIGVVRVERPDGTNAWVVHLPGTEDWSTIDSSNPFDMEGNLEGLTAASREAFNQQEVLVQELIKAALASSGALPGEDVLLTGHSGGGIHAAAAAADPAFLADVHVKMIIIAGSPAKNSGVGDGISVLDLQNENDIVTAADYGPPAPSRNWVTVTSHRPTAAGDGGLGEFLGDAHSMDNYADDAAALDRSDDPAVAASRETLRNFLGVGVAGAAVGGTKWVIQGRDVNNESKRKPGRTGVKKDGDQDQNTGRGRYRLGIR